MQVPCVVFLGDFSDERIDLEKTAIHVGWGAYRVREIHSFATLALNHEIPAVFFDQRTPDTPDDSPLRIIRTLLPETRLVICCPILLIPDIDLEKTGAFYAIARPLKAVELRNSIAFVWESWFRKTIQSHQLHAVA